MLTEATVRITVDPATVRDHGRGTMGFAGIILGLAALAVVLDRVWVTSSSAHESGSPMFWLLSFFLALYSCPLTAMTRALLWGRRFAGREYLLDAEGVTVSAGDRVVWSAAWREITSIAGSGWWLVISSRRGHIALVPRLCANSQEFMTELRRRFYAEDIASRLRLRAICWDLVAGAWWMGVLLVAVGWVFVWWARLLVASGDQQDWAEWRRAAGIVCVLAPGAGAVIAGMRFSRTWGAAQHWRGLTVSVVAGGVAAAWVWWLLRGHAPALDIAWRSGGAIAAAVVGVYIGLYFAGIGKGAWSREYFERMTGALPLFEGEKVLTLRRTWLWGTAGVGIACAAFFSVVAVAMCAGLFRPEPGIDLYARVAMTVMSLLALAGAGGCVWGAIGEIRRAKREGFSITAETFEWWDARGRGERMTWAQVTGLDVGGVSGIVIHHQPEGGDARTLKLNVEGWRSGLAEQLTETIRDRAQLTVEAAVNRGPRLPPLPTYRRAEGPE